MILDATTKTIEVVLEGAVTTNELDVTAGFADSFPGGAFLPGEQDESTSGATPVTAVSAPPSHVQRMVNEIRVYNKDTVAHTVTIQLNDNGTRRVLQKQTAAAGTVVLYSPAGGNMQNIPTLDYVELESGTTPVKVSAMGAATVPFAGTELLPVIQSSTNKQFAIADVINQLGTIVSALTQITFNANGVTAPGTFFTITSADASSGTTSAEMDFLSGNATGASVKSGPVFVGSGNSGAGDSGRMGLGSGSAGAASGNVNLGSGDAGTGASGLVNFFTGASTSGNTGNITQITGAAAAGNSGSITLTIGAATGAGKTTGDITLTLTAGSGGAGNGNLLLVNLPTSSAGLPSNAIWCDTGASNVLKRV